MQPFIWLHFHEEKHDFFWSVACFHHFIKLKDCPIFILML